MKKLTSKDYQIQITYNEEESHYEGSVSFWPEIRKGIALTPEEAVQKVTDSLANTLKLYALENIEPPNPMVELLKQFQPILNIRKISKITGLPEVEVKAKISNNYSFNTKELLLIKRALN